MSMIRHSGLRAALLAGVAVAAVLAIAPVQARVGVTSQTTNNPLGTPPQQQQRTLKVGIDVFANERIQTTANDRAHLLFLDGSSLTVGPNSDLLIDKFVFDPNTGKGELAVSATKGIFRLVGGKITKSNEATIKVGTSTIGIRGGITIVNAPECPPGTAAADCQAQAYFMFGQQLSVTNPNGSETATRPGSLIAFNGSAPPLPPVIAPPNSLVGPIAQLEAPSGQGNTGPAGTGIEQQTANSNLPPTNSGAPPDPTNGAPQTAQTANNTTGAGSVLTNTPDPNNPPQNPPPPNNEPPPPPPPVVTTISAEGRFLREEPFSGWSIDAVSVSAPRDPLNNAFLQTATVTTSAGPVVTLVTDPGTLDVTTATGVTFSVPWSPGTGDIAVTNLNSSSSLGPVTGTGWVSPAGDFYVYNLREADDRGTGFFGGTLTPNAGLPTTGFAAREFFTLQASAPFLTETISAEPVVAGATQGLTYIAWSPVLTPALASGNDQRATWFTATLNIQGQGEAQSSYLSIGTGNFFTDETKGGAIYAAGGNQAFVRRSAFEGPIKFTTATATAETQTGTAIYSPGGEHMVLVPEQVTYDGEGTTRTPGAAYSLPFDTLMITDVHYPVVASRPAASPPPDVGTVRTAQTLTGFAGALVENENGGGYSSYALRNADPNDVFITTSPSTNRAAGEFNLSQNPGGESDITTLRWGSLTGNSGAQQSSFIDDKRFAMRETGSQAGTYDFGSSNITTQMSMVTQAAVPDADFLPAGVSFCECQYLTWGYWQADLNYQEGYRAGQRDYVTLGTWVVGTPTLDVDLPLTGSATYTGHIIGNVENDMGNSYVAAGRIDTTWNFGDRTGGLAITNFDGANYAGTTSGSPGTGNFSGNFTGTSLGATNRQGQVSGAFFRSPTDATLYQAGNFSLNSIDSNYKAAGTWAAQRVGPVGPPVIVTVAP